MSEFESFVNTELPKRVATNQNPLTVPPGMVFVTTGVGLLTELLPYGGAPGGESIEYTAEAAEDVLAGQPVYLDNDGKIRLAQASSALSSRVVGFAKDAALATFLCTFVSDSQVVLGDWTSVVGATTLQKGKTYYLSPLSAGEITDIPPSTEGTYVVKVGTAMTTTKLDIEIQPSILL